MAWTDHMDELRAAVKTCNEIYKFGGQNATNLAGLISSNVSNFEPSTNRSQGHRRLQVLRSRLNDTLLQATAMLDEAITNMAETIGVRTRNPIELAQVHVPKYMNDNSEFIATRDVTRGSISKTTANTSIAAAQLNTITTDKYGNEIERVLGYDTASAPMEVVCVRDSSDSGVFSGEERFEARFSGTLPTPLDEIANPTANARTFPIRSKLPDSPGTLINNGSFASWTSSQPSNWWTTNSSGSWSGISENTTASEGYRPRRGSVTQSAPSGAYSQLEWAAAYTDTIFQPIVRSWSRETAPLFVAVRFKLKAGGTAGGSETFDLTLGTKTVTATPTTSAQMLILDTSTEENCWYENFKPNSEELKVKLTRTNPGSDALIVQGVWVFPRTYIGNGRWAMIYPAPGADDFVTDDKFEFTDQVGTPGLIQYWLFRKYGTHWPAASGMSITEADPV